MLLNRLSLFKFSAKKQVRQAGLIIEPQSFRKTAFIPRTLHWFRNVQTFNDMERHLSDFHHKKSHVQFMNLNNKLIEVIDKKSLRDLDTMVNEEYFKQIKSHLKHNEPIPLNFNLFVANKATIVQARSFTDTIVRLKSIDQWYQVIVEYENEQKKQKGYHVLERFYKQKQWKFVKFNL